MLRSIDQMWNANPMREVVPVDWAEIARALRTVWLRSLARPGKAIALGGRTQHQALAVGDRQLERGRPALVGPGRARQPAERRRRAATSGSRRRNGTSNPVYRTLKEMYLLASDWLLRARQSDRSWTMPSGSASISTSGSSSTP